MTTRVMYDGVTVSGLPAGAPLYAGYLDGHYANLPALRARFPHARIVEIAVRASTVAGHVLDVETGDATPAEAVGWVVARRHAGADPTVYCNTSTWPAVRAAFRNAGIPEPHYWIAAYSSDSSIPAGAVAHQWKSTATYDRSTVAAYWPGVDPAPTPTPVPEENDMPTWITGTVAPGVQPTVTLVPHGDAWAATPHRKLHLGADQLGTPPKGGIEVRVAIHNGKTWRIAETAVTASGGTVDVPLTNADQKVSLQTAGTGVSYAIEAW